MKYYAFFNPLAGNKKGEEQAKTLTTFYDSNDVEFIDITKIESYNDFISKLDEDDAIVVCGGDGTLNKFVNAISEIDVKQEILYYACGTGNDFYKDVGKEDNSPVAIKSLIQNLPTVTVNGKQYKFLNGVGFGIDGYCCEKGEELREKNAEKINYTSIAIKGCFFHYKKCSATVIVDGAEYKFKNVWLSPTMFGKYYGGGMIPAPHQVRGSDKISLMVFHCFDKLKTLIIFSKIFKGEHIKHKKNIFEISGKTITVKFDQPRTVQIDGETIKNVTEYTATI